MTSTNLPTLGIYVHWPYCLAKCPYCDFNSHVSARVDHDRWKSAYLTELRASRMITGDRTVATIFFGGGTPSLMPDGLVAAVLDEISRLWATADAIEVTIEANPTSVEATRFRGFRAAGVNRVSVGVQSLRDDDLRQLGRTHSSAEALRAMEVAGSTFGRVNMDLIYARQWQSLAAWEAELGEALALKTGHLSLYQLTIEEGTPFSARRERGLLRGLPGDDLAADLFDLTQMMCLDAGIPGYEVSNHARPGQQCLHNLRYWNLEDVVGIGPGAHGRVTTGGGRWTELSVREPQAWLHEIEAKGTATTREAQSAGEVADEYLIMGLRTVDGISLSRHLSLGGRGLPDDRVGGLVDLGLIRSGGDILAVSDSGRLVLNEIIRQLAC